MRLRVEIPVDKHQIEILVKLAIVYCYQRTNPELRWSRKEMHEAARYAMERAVHSAMYHTT